MEQKMTPKLWLLPIGLVAFIVLWIAIECRWLMPLRYWIYDNAPDWFVVLLMRF